MNYTDQLTAACANSDPLPSGWTPVAVYPCWVGLTHPDHGGTYMATPDWEGEPLPIEWQAEDGEGKSFDGGVAYWTGDLAKDVVAWREAVERVITTHRFKCPGCGVRVTYGPSGRECGREGDGLCMDVAFTLDRAAGKQVGWEGFPPQPTRWTMLQTRSAWGVKA